jgi:hypothetical protein
MTIRRRIGTAIGLVVLICSPSRALAQKVTTVEELTAKQTLFQLTGPLAARPVGEAIGLATALEIGTAPLGLSSGGFVFKLDPSTGLLVRTATTFGPSFAARAMTSGEGQVSVGVNFRSSSYDKISDLDLVDLRLGSVNAASPSVSSTGTADLSLSSRMLTVTGSVGVSENLDIGAAIPVVTIKLDGISTLRRADGVVPRLAEAAGVFKGLGDVAGLVKYRFFKFNDDLIDPGGLAVVVNMRLPTGNKDNLLGLGVTRTLVSFVASGRMGRIQPHANGGYEWWNKGVDVSTSFSSSSKVTARHAIQYAAGVEVEATPKLTFLVDFLGHHVRGAGTVGYVTDTVAPNASGITSVESLVGLSDSFKRLTLAPGLKVNLKAKILLSINALMTLDSNSLRSKVTPVVGIDMTL